jgi:glycosyltransferase involved in cell wall biosynthesis
LAVTKEWKPDAIFALTVITAPYALKVGHVRRVLDVDNLLSRYLREGYESTNGIARRARKWFAWQKFKRYEASVFNQFDLCITVTEQDRERVHNEFSIPREKIGVVSNGVDLAVNQGRKAAPVPGSLIFNGSLRYEPNREAMVYFVNEILPLIRRQRPEARLTITGKYDGVALDWLPGDGSVRLSGYVDDVKPLVGESWVCVVPLRQGAGTRLKILEAMALGTPVVSTPKGAEGLIIEDGRHLLIGATSEQFARRTLDLLEDADLRSKIVNNARKLVAENYNWADLERHFGELVHNLEIARSGEFANEPIHV